MPQNCPHNISICTVIFVLSGAPLARGQNGIVMEVDALLEALGRPGRYSLALYLLLCTNYAMVSISHFTMVIYTAPVPYHCAAPERPEVSEHRNNTTAAALDSCSAYGNASSGGDGPAPCKAGWTYDAKTGERNILMEVGHPIYPCQLWLMTGLPPRYVPFS